MLEILNVRNAGHDKWWFCVLWEAPRIVYDCIGINAGFGKVADTTSMAP